jgi:N-acetylglucosamine-6-phosphate deacetylase
MTRPSGFVDLQVNGYAGVDFNAADLNAEQLHRACQVLRDDGVEAILATVITGHVADMAACLSTIAATHAEDALVRDIIVGIHIEGPFLNERPGYAGAHPASAIRPSDADVMKRLLDAAAGLTRVVTLAPERDPQSSVTRLLADQGVVVSAGHCDPTVDQLQAAIDAGLAMFTHLGNGCPGILDRHDNVIQRVLSLSDQLCISFIADGVHVPYFALRNYLDRVGFDRAVVVTDAISAAGLGPGTYSLGKQTVVVDSLGVTRYPGDDSHLAGSAATMPMIVERLSRELQLGDPQLRRLVCDNPRRILDG